MEEIEEKSTTLKNIGVDFQEESVEKEEKEDEEQETFENSVSETENKGETVAFSEYYQNLVHKQIPLSSYLFFIHTTILTVLVIYIISSKIEALIKYREAGKKVEMREIQNKRE